MKILNNRIVSQPSKLYLEDFVEKSLINQLDTEEKIICNVENALINDLKDKDTLKNISYENCKGCLCCIEKRDADGFNSKFQPIMNSQANSSFDYYTNSQFLGKYNKNLESDDFMEYFSKSEVKKTTPLACNIFFRISKNGNQSFYRSSPYAETNIKTPNDPRDGKLDLVILNPIEKKLLVIESKKNLSSLINDKKRDQWNKYKDQIIKISNKYNVQFQYLILIGGKEVEIYPKGAISSDPVYDQRSRFYEYIKDKKFFSLNFLHNLLICSLVKKNIFWEDIFFDNKDHIGFLSAGLINNKKQLKPIIFNE